MRNEYYNLITKVEKIHRMFLDALNKELENMKVKDIKSVQASIVFNIGKEEVNINTLMTREYYLGSNANYNLRKLIENNYLFERRDEFDKRQTIVWLTEKGLQLYEDLGILFGEHQEELRDKGIEKSNFYELLKNMGRIEDFFSEVSSSKKFN